jgi:uncharacterized RDD family membrane protein YckC
MQEILDSEELRESAPRSYEYASSGKRFANYLIDLVSYYTLAILIGTFIGVVFNLPEDAPYLQPAVTIEHQLIENVLGLLMIVSYYTLFEYFFAGKTVGKWITKTRAVTQYDERMNFTTALGRSFCRLIPFEAFSFLGDSPTGWHDRFSGTKVVEDGGWDG